MDTRNSAMDTAASKQEMASPQTSQDSSPDREEAAEMRPTAAAAAQTPTTPTAPNSPEQDVRDRGDPASSGHPEEASLQTCQNSNAKDETEAPTVEDAPSSIAAATPASPPHGPENAPETMSSAIAEIVEITKQCLRFQPSAVSVYCEKKGGFSEEVKRAVRAWRCSEEPRMDLAQLSMLRGAHCAIAALHHYFSFLEPREVPADVQNNDVQLRNHPLYLAIANDNHRAVKECLALCPNIDLTVKCELDFLNPHPFFVRPRGQLPPQTPTRMRMCCSALELARMQARVAIRSYVLDHHIKRLMGSKPFPLVVTQVVLGFQAIRPIYVDLLAEDVQFPEGHAHLQTFLRALALGDYGQVLQVPFISEFIWKVANSRWMNIEVFIDNVDFGHDKKVNNTFLHTGSFAAAAVRAARYGGNPRCEELVRSFYEDFLRDPLYHFLAMRSDWDFIPMMRSNGEMFFLKPLNWVKSANRGFVWAGQ